MKTYIAILCLATSVLADSVPKKVLEKRSFVSYHGNHDSHLNHGVILGHNRVSSPLSLGFSQYNGQYHSLSGPVIGANVHTTVTKHIGIPIPAPYAVPLDRPVPVPVRVAVPVAIDRPYPVPVPRPYPVTVEKHVAVPVDRPVPVPVPHAVPVPIVKQVGVPVPHLYPVAIPKPVAVPVLSPVPVPIVKSFVSPGYRGAQPQSYLHNHGW